MNERKKWKKKNKKKKHKTQALKQYLGIVDVFLEPLCANISPLCASPFHFLRLNSSHRKHYANMSLRYRQLRIVARAYTHTHTHREWDNIEKKIVDQNTQNTHTQTTTTPLIAADRKMLVAHNCFYLTQFLIPIIFTYFLFAKPWHRHENRNEVKRRRI